MKVENLTVGNIYYVSVTDYKGIATSFKVGKLVEIVNKSSVILEDRKGKQFKSAVKKLHKTADKAVQTKKGKQLAKQYMAELKQKEEESLVDKKIQRRIKQLGKSIYVTMVKNKYIVKGYEQSISFRTVEELNAWIDTELAKFENIKAEILNNGYKHLCVTCKDGHKEYYTIINISFKKFEIFCKHFSGNSQYLENENLLMREDVRGLKLRIHK